MALTLIFGDGGFIRRNNFGGAGPRTVVQNGSSPGLPEPGEVVRRVGHHVARLLQQVADRELQKHLSQLVGHLDPRSALSAAHISFSSYQRGLSSTDTEKSAECTVLHYSLRRRFEIDTTFETATESRGFCTRAKCKDDFARRFPAYRTSLK
nr:unnamed protein product [Callosobruchus chinensis]